MSIESVRAYVNVGQHFHIYIHLYIFTEPPAGISFLMHLSTDSSTQMKPKLGLVLPIVGFGGHLHPPLGPLLKLEMTGTL